MEITVENYGKSNWKKVFQFVCFLFHETLTEMCELLRLLKQQ